MATFEPIPYTYMPTAPRSKRVTARCKPTPEQFNVLDKIQYAELSSTSLDTPRPSAANKDYGSRIQETGAAYGDSDDDNNLPTIEEILYTTLQKKKIKTADPGSDSTVLEGAVAERGGPIDHSGSASGGYSGGSRDNPIDLLGNDDPNTSETRVDDNSLCAERAAALDADHFCRPDTPLDSISLAAASGSEGYGIECYDFLGTTPHLPLTKQSALMSKSIQSYPTLRLLSEPLHDDITTEGLPLHNTGSKTTTSCSVNSQSTTWHRSGTLPENQLSQDYPCTRQSFAGEHEPKTDGLVLDPDGGQRQQQEDKVSDMDDGQQQKANHVAVVLTVESMRNAYSSSKESGGLGSAERRQSPFCDLLPKSSHSEAVSLSDSDCDDRLNDKKADSDGDWGPRSAKRKRSSFNCGPRSKKRKRCQWRSTCQFRSPSKSRPKSCSPLDNSPKVFNLKGRLSLPAAPQAVDTKSSDCGLQGRPCRNTQPTLAEVTFRPHSPQCCSFTAVIRDSCNGRGVSFSQLIRLIENIGYVGKINDLTIKPLQQYSYLLTGFSLYTTPPRLSSGTTVSIAAEATPMAKDVKRTRPRRDNTVNAECLVSQGNELFSTDEDSGFSGSDTDPSSNDDGCSTEGEKGRPRTHNSHHNQWTDLDEQRLLAYRKEGKSWTWIFKKFPGRTQAAVRTRLSMIQRRAK